MQSCFAKIRKRAITCQNFNEFIFIFKNSIVWNEAIYAKLLQRMSSLNYLNFSVDG